MVNFFIAFVQWSPLISILSISIVLNLILILVYKKLINQQKYNELKKRQKELRAKMKEASKNKDITKMNDIQKELLKISAENMKITMKPTIIIMIPLLIFFWILGKIYTSAGIGNIIYWGKDLPIIHEGAGWLLCYIIFSLISSIVFRKIFKV